MSRTQTPLTCRRYVSTAGDGDNESDKPVTAKSVVESSDRHDDVVRCRTRHRHTDATEPTVFAASSLPDACRIKKSLSFRAQPQRTPSGTDEAVRNVTSLHTFGSLPRPARQPSGLQQQQYNQSGAPAARLTETSRYRCISSRDSSFSPNQNDKRNSASKRSQSPASRERNTIASKLMTQRDTDIAEQSQCDSTEDSADNMRLEADRQGRRRAAVNWYVDLSDVASNDFRPLRVDRLQQHQGKGNCGAADAASRASLAPTTKTWNAADQRGSTTTGKSDQLQHRRRRDATKTTNTVASTSPLDDVHEKCTPLQRTLSLKHSPKTDRTSELRTSKDHGSSEEHHMPNDAKWRRSRSMTRQKDHETFRYAGSTVQPAERSSTRTRSASLSERYRAFIVGDSSVHPDTSSAVVGRRKPVKPFELSRRLKADFVIYV